MPPTLAYYAENSQQNRRTYRVYRDDRKTAIPMSASVTKIPVILRNNR
jgi:hypothetical protein